MAGDLRSSVLFILGIGMLGGTLGAWFFQRIRVPQVVGYLVIGLLIGESGLRLVSQADVVALRPFNQFALGIIGFLVGGELRMDSFRRYLRQFMAIMLGEGLGAFALVGAATTALFYAVLRDLALAVAGGVVLGAIASATDPASTLDVLWESRARGVLSTSIVAVVALDDALAMVLYGFGTGIAQVVSSGSGSISGELGHVCLEVLGAVAAGAAFAFVLWVLLRTVHQSEKGLAVAFGLILLLICLCLLEGLDIIMAAMTLGFVLANAAPRRSADVFKLMRGFATPIYVLFFVLVGARLGISDMPGWLWGVVGAYVLCRSAGKFAGAYLGARATGADPVVRRYLGFGLATQGGVAIGLSIVAGQRLGAIPAGNGLELGDLVISVVAATTLLVQLAGPPLVKLAVKWAGEAGRDVTEEDVAREWNVAQVMDRAIAPIREDRPLSEVIHTFAEHDYLAYPVVDRGGALVGSLSLEGLKSVLQHNSTWDWLLTSDVMEAVGSKTVATSCLHDVLRNMRDTKEMQVPVVDEADEATPVGMLDLTRAEKCIGDEILRRQQLEPAA